MNKLELLSLTSCQEWYGNDNSLRQWSDCYAGRSIKNEFTDYKKLAGIEVSYSPNTTIYVIPSKTCDVYGGEGESLEKCSQTSVKITKLRRGGVVIKLRQRCGFPLSTCIVFVMLLLNTQYVNILNSQSMQVIVRKVYYLRLEKRETMQCSE